MSPESRQCPLTDNPAIPKAPNTMCGHAIIDPSSVEQLNDRRSSEGQPERVKRVCKSDQRCDL